MIQRVGCIYAECFYKFENMETWEALEISGDIFQVKNCVDLFTQTFCQKKNSHAVDMAFEVYTVLTVLGIVINSLQNYNSL